MRTNIRPSKGCLHIAAVLAAVMLLVFCCTFTADAAGLNFEAASWSALQEAINNADSGDVVTLISDVTADKTDSALEIPTGSVVFLDLNGYTADRNMSENGGSDGAVITVQRGAVLTVRDSSATASGKITGGYSTEGGGIVNYGTLIIEGGSVTGNRASEKGGGIANYSIFVLEGGTLTANSAGESGGGIFNGVKGRMMLDMKGINGNNAPDAPDMTNIGAINTVGGGGVHYDSLDSYLAVLSVLPPLVLLIVLFFAAALDNYLNKGQKKALFIITAAVFALVLQNYFDFLQPGNSTFLKTLTVALGYALRPGILALFMHLISPERHYRLVWAAVGINAALYLTAFFSPLTFYFSDRHFHAGVLNNTCLILSSVLFAYCLYLTFKVFRPRQRKESWIPVFALVMIGAAVAMDYTVEYHYQPVSFLTIAIVISSMMYYIWLHLQLVREHERELQAEHRIQIMRTQIQPHFLFNTLNAVIALCEKDPGSAARTLGLFSVYLRQNLESLDNTELIPLSKELEHTRVFSEIEMIRFPNIRVVYDIRDDEFSIPALTVQPLVENAIRHGVRSCEEGIVKVSTYREGSEHLIVIEDNGTGFDMQQTETSGGTHIGIKNVRERLEQMCGGKTEINSTPDKGTRIVLRIPAKKELEK